MSEPKAEERECGERMAQRVAELEAEVARLKAEIVASKPILDTYWKHVGDIVETGG